MIFEIENSQTIFSSNVEAVEVVDCLANGCWVVPGMHEFYVATGDVGVARQDIEGSRCDEVPSRYEVGSGRFVGHVTRQCDGVEGCSWVIMSLLWTL